MNKLEQTELNNEIALNSETVMVISSYHYQKGLCSFFDGGSKSGPRNGRCVRGKGDISEDELGFIGLAEVIDLCKSSGYEVDESIVLLIIVLWSFRCKNMPFSQGETR